MSLLEEIWRGAIEDNVSVAVVLRKLRTLAYRLEHEPLKEWIEYELNNYPSDDVVPAYRRKPTGVMGTFLCANGLYLPAYPVPRQRVAEILSESMNENDPRFVGLFTNIFDNGVAALESMVAEGATDMRSHWNADLVNVIGERILPDCNCIAVWRVVTKPEIVGVLDAVRNKVQTFALEIEAKNPNAGEAPLGEGPPVSLETVTKIFQTTITGGTNVIAIAGRDVAQDIQQTAISTGDRSALMAVLGDLGVDQAALADLAAALDAEEGTEGVVGPKVGRWLRRAASTLGYEAAAGLIINAVLSYLGIGS